MISVPRDSKDALRYASEVKEENLIFNSNYQAIAKCWDEKAAAGTLNSLTRFVAHML